MHLHFFHYDPSPLFSLPALTNSILNLFHKTNKPFDLNYLQWQFMLQKNLFLLYFKIFNTSIFVYLLFVSLTITLLCWQILLGKKNFFMPSQETRWRHLGIHASHSNFIFDITYSLKVAYNNWNISKKLTILRAKETCILS